MAPMRRRSDCLRAASAALSILLVPLLVSACASPPPEVPTAAMDVAIDSAGQGLFYVGTAWIPRGFNSTTPFEMTFDLDSWGSPPVDETGARAAAALASGFPRRGTYQPLGNGHGTISFLDGRFQLRGEILDDGTELAGDWFLDHSPGGSFRIAQKGFIFP